MNRASVICVLSTVATLFAHPALGEKGDIAAVSIGSGGITWQPLAAYPGLSLAVKKPDGEVFQGTFPAGVAPSFSLSGGYFPDGQYTWELRVVYADSGAIRGEEAADAETKDTAPPTPVQSGYFTVSQGAIVVPGAPEEAELKDIVHSDDVVIYGSLAVGNDTYSGYSFGFDTIVLMENNLRILFDDTSSIQNYPRNDWRLVANDSTDGGGNYFAIEDATEADKIFVLEAGAPANSLYVDSHGDVGINTSTPYYELHIVDGDSPCVRLEQDGSYGWTPQKWDLCGNESNFFIRDATHASRLPFRIEPECPTDTIFMKSNGYVGIGTGAPGWPLEVETTGEAATLVLDRTDGAMAYLNAGGTYVNVGSASNNAVNLMVNGDAKMTVDTGGYVGIGTGAPGYPLELETTGENATFLLDRTDGAMAYVTAGGSFVNMGSASFNHLRLMVNGVWRTQINTDGTLHMSNGAYCSIGGVWTDASSRELKDNIESLSTDEAMEALASLEPVKYNYKVDETDAHVGFIAEDAPDLVASKDRKGMSPMDITAVLTKVVQEQGKAINEQRALVQRQQRVISQQQLMMTQLQARLDALEQEVRD